MTDNNNHSKDPLRPIRSFVRREGRMTLAQRQALERYWPEFGLSLTKGLFNFTEIFGRPSEVILEIGFGMGQSLVAMAMEHPELDYLGVEVHRPGIGALLHQIVENQLTNIRVVQQDVAELLDRHIADESLSGVQIYFPDPWPKSRHHKRRLIQPEFIEKIWRKLKFGGKIHLATDWQNYAEQMMTVMSEAVGFNNMAGHGNFIVNNQLRPLTKFEQRGLRLGHEVWDLLFIKMTK